MNPVATRSDPSPPFDGGGAGREAFASVPLRYDTAQAGTWSSGVWSALSDGDYATEGGEHGLDQ